MAWNGLVLTVDGRNALSSAQLSGRLEIRSIVVGDGMPPANFRTLKGLVGQLYEIEDIKMDVADGRLTVTADFPEVGYDYHFREIGVMAATEDGAILYAYDNCGEDAQHIVSTTGAESTRKRIRLTLDVSDVAEVTVSNPSVLYVAYDDYEATIAQLREEIEEGGEALAGHLADKGNPHGVTKEQVGLGNVPNVSTDDQAPTFTQANAREDIRSGERLSVLFGKIWKWLADLKAVAFSGSYNDLSDRPSIGDGTVTINQGGVKKGSFSMNQSGDSTIDLSVSQGPKGDTGATGATGAAGVSVSSVTQTTTSTADGGENVITVTLSNGTKSTFKVRNGSKGSTGATGAQGPKGATGATGAQGPQGIQGKTGATGPQGPQGPAGVNATTTAVATQSANGLMSAADKKKLDGISASAEGARTITEASNTSAGIYTSSSKAYSKNGWCYAYLELNIKNINQSAWTTIGYIEGAAIAVPIIVATNRSNNGGSNVRLLASGARTQIMVQTGSVSGIQYCSAAFPCT